MDFQLPADDDPRRLEVRAWLAVNPTPTGRQLAEAGYVAPHWPRPWGLGADPILQLIVEDELARAGVQVPMNPMGTGWGGPTLLVGGTQAQKERYLLPMLAGEEFWCQLFSEPGSGSDLANLGTRAVRDGDEFVINGQKIWTTSAEHSDFGILIARTDPDLPKHKGISYFICPMHLPGIEVRTITEMTGGHHFCEVFLTDVRIPAELLVGDLNDGWRLAKVTLGNERVSLSTGGVLWGNGPTGLELLDAIRAHGPLEDPLLRQRAATVYTEHVLLDLIRMRTLTAAVKGHAPGPEVSIRKLLADEHGQRVMSLARDIVGVDAMLQAAVGTDYDPERDGRLLNAQRAGDPLAHPSWYHGFLFSQALTIGGGTFAVQRNIIGERVLGLPRDEDVTLGMSWSESQRMGTSR
jgi:alkylation response protein AidB-like acyl-CoA dehydrogenase